MSEFYCGFDIGTSSTKATVYDDALQPVFSETCHYEFLGRGNTRVELNPDDVFNAVVTCLKACFHRAFCSSTSLSFVSFGSALHSFIAADTDGSPLTNCVTWADMRGTEFNDELGRCLGGQIYKKTGCPGNAIYMPAKILWLRKYRPDIFDTAPSEKELAERIKEVDGLLVGVDPLTRRVIENADTLRAVSNDQ